MREPNRRARKEMKSGREREREGGREGARKFARNYIYEARSGTLTDGERSYTDGSRSEVFRETAAAVFLF